MSGTQHVDTWDATLGYPTDPTVYGFSAWEAGMTFTCIKGGTVSSKEYIIGDRIIYDSVGEWDKIPQKDGDFAAITMFAREIAAVNANFNKLEVKGLKFKDHLGVLRWGTYDVGDATYKGIVWGADPGGDDDLDGLDAWSGFWRIRTQSDFDLFPF